MFAIGDFFPLLPVDSNELGSTDTGQNIEFDILISFGKKQKLKKKSSTEEGFEPSTFGLEVQRAIHCATRPVITQKGFLIGLFDVFEEGCAG